MPQKRVGGARGARFHQASVGSTPLRVDGCQCLSRTLRVRRGPKGQPMHENNTMDRPKDELSFSFARFAEGFDKHIRQSIRGYVDLLSDCVALSEYFVEG